MHVHQHLTHQIAEDACRRVSARVRKHLRSLRAQLSGDDSGLANVWEEFCVQVQGEESFFWDTYVETVEDAIRRALMTIRPLEATAIWLQTDAGVEWLEATDEDGVDAPVALEPDVINWVYKRVWRQADQYRHARVVSFLARAVERD